MKILHRLFSATVLVCAAIASPAMADTTYNLVTQDVSGVTTSGTITTDGTLGVLSTSNILGFDITLSGLGLSDQSLSSSTTPYFVLGDYLTATDRGLFWNYAQGVGAEFSIAGSSTDTQFHFYTDRTDVDFHGTEYALYQNGVQLAGTPAVPEPATWAMMLLGFGAIGVSMRRRKARPADALMQVP